MRGGIVFYVVYAESPHDIPLGGVGLMLLVR